ncbi:MAG: CHAT domain-containing protein [Bacteroidota bacterium]
MQRFFFVGILFSFSLTAIAQYSGTAYESLKKQFEAEAYKEVLAQKNGALAFAQNRQDSVAADVYSYIGYAYSNLGQADSALVFFEREYLIRKSLKLVDYSNYSNTLYNLMTAYNQAGNYAAATAIGEELLAEDKAHYGVKSREYGESVIFYLRTLADQGNFRKAKEEAEKILADIGDDHLLYALVLNNYADILAAVGEHSKSEKIFYESLKGIRAGTAMGALDEASVSVNLASLYVDKGQYIEAEEIYTKALATFKAHNSVEAQEMYYSSLNNLGIAWLRLSRMDEATRLYDELLEHDKVTYGQEHPYFISSLNNAGTAFTDAGDYTKASGYLELALQLEKAYSGDQSYEYASLLNNLGKLRYLNGQPKEAIPMLEQAADIFGNEVGKESMEYATVVFNQGVAWAMLKSTKAKSLLTEASRIRQKKFGEAHPKFGETTSKLALYEWMMNNPKGAQDHFKTTFTNYYLQIDRYFPGLSEAEKTSFYYQGLRPQFEVFNSFALQHEKKLPELTASMYDVQLNTKGLILYATNKVRATLQKNGDRATLQQYEDWLQMKEQISKMYAAADESRAGELSEMEKAANAIEKELTKKSASFEKNVKRTFYTWKDVQAKLGKDEAAIEMVRFRDFSPDSGGYYTGQVRYAALVVKKSSKRPELVLLQNPGNRLEKQNLSYYRNAIKFEITDNYSYDLFWKPIALQLAGIKKIYFSPDGVYNQINLNALRNPSTGKYLLEETVIENVTNTKDLVARAAPGKRVGKTYLYGFPQYAITTEVQQEKKEDGVTRKIHRGERAGILRFLRGENGIVMLPGTKNEVEKIQNILKAANETPATRLSKEAQEHSLKNLDEIRLLHIATHGFFLDDPDFALLGNAQRYIENPLLRAGLIMAGAEDFLRTGELVAEGGQDGILTAMEVMDLPLDQSELVVLSACETGLGTIQNGEGVYGLRRAFAIAGAPCVVMSMWNVDDEATQELMTNFYSNWLKGMSKQDAFREAQFQLKEKYPNPFFWSAFVMIGE